MLGLGAGLAAANDPVPGPFPEEPNEEEKAPVQGPASQGDELHVITGLVDMEIYGYFKLDAAYDTARTSVGDFARWVESEEFNEDAGQFSMTARQTRFGLRLNGPDDGSFVPSGRDYLGVDSGDSVRIQFAIIYAF